MERTYTHVGYLLIAAFLLLVTATYYTLHSGKPIEPVSGTVEWPDDMETLEGPANAKNLR